MNKELEPFVPIAQAISTLLYPQGEVIIHDLKTDRIAAIFNPFSKRKVGDESLLQEVRNASELPDIFPVYFKTNWDGRKLRSISITLKNPQNISIGLLCINLDVSKWEEMGHFLLRWAQGWEAQPYPELLFKDDWRERINTYVSEYLKKENLSLKSLVKEKKKSLVRILHQKGAFSAKNAAYYVADVLDISRATLYNYLRSE